MVRAMAAFSLCSWCSQCVNQAQLGVWVLEAHVELCCLLLSTSPLSAVHLRRDIS